MRGWSISKRLASNLNFFCDFPLIYIPSDTFSIVLTNSKKNEWVIWSWIYFLLEEVVNENPIKKGSALLLMKWRLILREEGVAVDV